MANSKPWGSKILFCSAATSCGIVILYLVLLAFTIFRLNDDRTLWSVIVACLFFLPFFLHGAFIIFFLKRYYPAIEIPKSYRIGFKIIVALVIILLSLFLLGIIVSALSEEERASFEGFFENSVNKIFVVSLAVVVIAQIHMLFAGKRLLEVIKNNYRNSLLNNW